MSPRRRDNTKIRSQSTIRGRELGYHLRAAIEAAELTIYSVADRLERSPSNLSRVLSGERGLPETDAVAIFTLCNAERAQQGELLELCGTNAYGSFTRSGLARWDSYRFHVLVATEVVEFAPYVLPWMVQTADYTSALHRADGLNHGGESRYRGDLMQQLLHEGAPALCVVIHEWALRSPWASAETMRDQLLSLLALPTRGQFTIRVLPATAGPLVTLTGPFTALHSDEHPLAFCREGGSVATFTDSPAEVERLRQVEGRILTLALDVPASRELIGGIVEELATPPGGLHLVGAGVELGAPDGGPDGWGDREHRG